MADRPTKRQRRAELTADQLLEAARGVFETVGYQAASVSMITRAADTAHGTFYLHFRNKRDVFSRVVYEMCREMYDAGENARWDQGTPDPLDGIRAGLRSFFELFSAHRGLWRALLEAALDDTEIEAMWMDIRRPFIARIEEVLRQLTAAGAIEPLDTRTWATALSAMVEWVGFTHFVMAQGARSPADYAAAGESPAAPLLATLGPAESAAQIEHLVDGLSRMWFRAVFTGADLPAFGATLA